jgi:hypothetical protein
MCADRLRVRIENSSAAAGFELEGVTERTIESDVEEWYEFLAAFADAVLGWVGGSARSTGRKRRRRQRPTGSRKTFVKHR